MPCSLESRTIPGIPRTRLSCFFWSRGCLLPDHTRMPSSTQPGTCSSISMVFGFFLQSYSISMDTLFPGVFIVSVLSPSSQFLTPQHWVTDLTQHFTDHRETWCTYDPIAHWGFHQSVSIWPSLLASLGIKQLASRTTAQKILEKSFESWSFLAYSRPTTFRIWIIFRKPIIGSWNNDSSLSITHASS